MERREHRIDLEPAPRGKAAWLHEGRRIGESLEPICAASRWLLSKGIAQPDDTVTTYRQGKPCLTAIVEAAAALTVEEPARGGLRFRKWRPITAREGVSRHGAGAQDASGDVLATMVAIAFQNERSGHSTEHHA